jgi:hypothetical protein
MSSGDNGGKRADTTTLSMAESSIEVTTVYIIILITVFQYKYYIKAKSGATLIG